MLLAKQDSPIVTGCLHDNSLNLLLFPLASAGWQCGRGRAHFSDDTCCHTLCHEHISDLQQEKWGSAQYQGSDRGYTEHQEPSAQGRPIWSGPRQSNPSRNKYSHERGHPEKAGHPGRRGESGRPEGKEKVGGGATGMKCREGRDQRTETQ